MSRTYVNKQARGQLGSNTRKHRKSNIRRETKRRLNIPAMLYPFEAYANRMAMNSKFSDLTGIY